jgi:hypothetical protein
MTFGKKVPIITPLRTYTLRINSLVTGRKFELQDENSNPAYYINVKQKLFSKTSIMIHQESHDGPVLATSRMGWNWKKIDVILGDPEEIAEEKRDWNCMQTDSSRGKLWTLTVDGMRLGWRHTKDKSLGSSKWCACMDYELIDLDTEERYMVFTWNRNWRKLRDCGHVRYYKDLPKDVEMLATIGILSVEWEFSTMMSASSSSSSGSSVAAAVSV